MAHTTALAVIDAHAAYGPIEVLHGVSLTVRAKQIVCLIGANGAGKTTLMRLLSGSIVCSTGSIHLFGRDVTAMPPHSRVRAGLSLVPEGRQVFASLSVEDNLLLGGYVRTSAERRKSLDEAYELFPVLAQKRGEVAGTLSGGQQQMLAISRALMSRPSLVLLDEPSMGLAPLLIAEVFARIALLRERGASVLIVEQNAQAALSLADYGYVMEGGRIVLSNRAAVLLGDERVQQHYLGS